ncbi:hypothetical protein ACFLXE_05525 [Chloroflexota bacterium]
MVLLVSIVLLLSAGSSGCGVNDSTAPVVSLGENSETAATETTSYGTADEPASTETELQSNQDNGEDIIDSSNATDASVSEAGSTGPIITEVPILLDEVVIFPDPSLESVIRKRIDKPNGDIRQSDLKGLTYLHASNKGITDLTDLGSARLGRTSIIAGSGALELDRFQSRIYEAIGVSGQVPIEHPVPSREACRVEDHETT